MKMDPLVLRIIKHFNEMKLEVLEVDIQADQISFGFPNCEQATKASVFFKSLKWDWVDVEQGEGMWWVIAMVAPLSGGEKVAA